MTLRWPVMGEPRDELTLKMGGREVPEKGLVVPQAIQEKENLERNKAEGNPGFPPDTSAEE